MERLWRKKGSAHFVSKLSIWTNISLHLILSLKQQKITNISVVTVSNRSLSQKKIVNRMLISYAFVAFVVVDNQQGSWNHLDTFLYICADVLSLWSLSAKNLLLPRSSCWLSASAKIHSTLADIQCLVVQRALEPGIVLDSDHGFFIIHQLKEYKGYLLEPSWVSLWRHNQPSLHGTKFTGASNLAKGAQSNCDIRITWRESWQGILSANESSSANQSLVGHLRATSRNLIAEFCPMSAESAVEEMCCQDNVLQGNAGRVCIYSMQAP